MAAPRVVIIGAGVVGAALADELSALGWTDVTVVDQGALPAPGGSSSHAPGLVFQTNSAKVMSQLARYTVEKLVALDCFDQVGSLEVATTPQRLAELRRRHGWATAWGIPAQLLTPQEAVARHDLLDPSVVLGALWVPTDGLARAVAAVTAQLDRARARGVRVLDRTEVRDILVTDGAVRGVRTDGGDLPADIVVCCAGIWGPKVGAMAGVPIPLVPLAHQLAWTAPLPALAGATPTGQQAAPDGGPPPGGARRPILRHQDADLYYRERGDRLAIGYYGHRPLPVRAEEIAAPADAPVMPSMLAFTPDDFAPAWQESQRLLPLLRDSTVDSGMNGLFSFTTDTFPLIGEAAAVKGFWVAEAVWVTHSAGVARAVAESLVRGRCDSFDLHECELSRFEPHQLAPDYVLARGCQNYVEVYDILHPLQPMQEPRPLRTSPFHTRQRELGAEFLEGGGWERPQWYHANAALPEPGPTPGEWASRYSSPIAGAEARATRAGVALYDMTPLKRLSVSGPGAARYLHWITTGNVDRRPGTVTYCLLLDDDGRIRSDVTVARLSADEFQVGVNSATDLDWLARHAPGDVNVRDITGGTCCIGLWGPKARDLLAPIAALDLAKGYFTGQRGYVGHTPVTALRLSYVGELGWELYTEASYGEKLWDTLWQAGEEHGAVAAGRAAFASLRIEKGYRLFGTDLTYEHDPFEAGLDFAISWKKGDFHGRTALERRREAGPPQHRLVTLVGNVGKAEDTVVGKEPVFEGDECVGYITSAAYGYTVDRPIALAWLPAQLAKEGTEVEIGYFDRRIPMRVAASPLVDPEMKRLKA
jgi:dimethylglycine oxidase